MAIAERIRFFRTKCGMTLKCFGMALGFPEKSSDIRIVQYENGSREPKADLTASMAKVLGVSPRALKVPDIDTDLGLMHTLRRDLPPHRQANRRRLYGPVRDVRGVEGRGAEAGERGNHEGRVRSLAIHLPSG